MPYHKQVMNTSRTDCALARNKMIIYISIRHDNYLFTQLKNVLRNSISPARDENKLFLKTVLRNDRRVYTVIHEPQKSANMVFFF
jgi:hypothetical protein